MITDIKQLEADRHPVAPKVPGEKKLSPSAGLYMRVAALIALGLFATLSVLAMA